LYTPLDFLLFITLGLTLTVFTPKSSINSNVKQKNDKVRDQNKINIEITNEKQNGGNTGHNNSKIEEKQKKFGLSMKRLVKRMEGSMSTDLRSKMLATRLS
jgi:hypothetical protein